MSRLSHALYRLQTRAGLTGPEARAAVVLVLALAGGLAAQQARRAHAPAAPDFYASTDAAFVQASQQGAAQTDSLPSNPAPAETLDSDATPAALADAVVARSAGPSPEAPVNVNRASVADLVTLPGVGAVTAARIAEARPFRDLADLEARVRGIGPAKAARLAPTRPLLTTGPAVVPTDGQVRPALPMSALPHPAPAAHRRSLFPERITAGRAQTAADLRRHAARVDHTARILDQIERLDAATSPDASPMSGAARRLADLAARYVERARLARALRALADLHDACDVPAPLFTVRTARHVSALLVPHPATTGALDSALGWTAGTRRADAVREMAALLERLGVGRPFPLPAAVARQLNVACSQPLPSASATA